MCSRRSGRRRLRSSRRRTHAKRQRRADADDDFDWEDDGEEEGEEETADEDSLTAHEKAARAWDTFLRLVRAMRPFERDDPAYSATRAVETFNAAGAVVKEWKRLNPNAISACPHVALCVRPRQQKEHGDHERRGADHGEAYGASIKDGLHRRTLRRKLGKTATMHTKKMANGTEKTWMQGPLRVSRVMQAFREMAVYERVMREEGSERYAQRKHYKLKSTGFATAARAAAKQCEEAPAEDAIFSVVTQRVKDSREHS